MPRQFVIGDIHGCLKQLRSCLVQAKFDYENDTLITLGDVVDRGPDSKGVVDLLLTIKNRVDIKGNHDDIFNIWITKGVHPFNWLQGGVNTLSSYVMDDPSVKIVPNAGSVATNATYLNIPKEHRDFFANQVHYYVDSQNRCFVHGGFDRTTKIDLKEDMDYFLWDRGLFTSALSSKNEKSINDVNGFKRIFVGHTPTFHWKKNGDAITTPIYAAQVVNCDTGACFGYKLSLIDITDDENHVLYQA